MTCNEDVRRLKNKLSLDFNQPKSTKKQKACQLTTPDLDKLALSTPQMTEYLKTIAPVGPLTTFTRIINNNDEEKQKLLEMWSNQTLAMSNSQQQQQTNEIELVEMNKTKSTKKLSNEMGVKTSTGKTNNTKSKGFQPINMEDQEQAKLERKRLRNRIAASKCRQRKLERIQNLQKKVDEYNDKIKQLQRFETLLKDVNNQLVLQIQKHKDQGCVVELIR